MKNKRVCDFCTHGNVLLSNYPGKVLCMKNKGHKLYTDTCDLWRKRSDQRLNKFISMLCDLVREVKQAIVWMKACEYPTCEHCVYHTHEDERCNMLERKMHAREYCSKWEEEE